ncbi:MAG: ROK family protein [Verrucomicrobiota bacterium]
MTSDSLLWGIDLGGTKIEIAVCDPARPAEPIVRRRCDTGASLGYDHIVSQIARCVREALETSGSPAPTRIGVGTPGATDPLTGSLKNSNTVCLNGRPLREDLAAALDCEVILANDANCFTLAEALWGSGSDSPVVLGLILGTGVGGGICVDGKILHGLHGIAGEWGHNPIPGEDTPCYCGRRGCVETVIAGPSLERFHRESGGGDLKLPRICELAAAGDPAAVQTLQRLREKFAQAIAAVINILDPDAIIIGGGVGNIPLLYENETRLEILRHLFNPELKTKILPPALGDSAGVFGAALLSK